jgi:hypothetical protein
VSLDSAQRDVVGNQQKIAQLQRDKAREAGRLAEALRKAGAAAQAAARASSLSTLQSKGREAQRYQAEAATYQEKVADLDSKIAAEQKRLLDSQKKLNAEQARMSNKQLEEQRKLAREQDRQMRSVAGTLAKHSRLHKATTEAVEKLQQPPERITVLFLALDPRDQTELQLGEEARAIAEMIRKSEHRDAVRLESRWAVRPLDLLQGLNETRPRVVHFSGHGSTQDELLFQDDVGGTKAVSKEAIVQTMAATSGDIQLVFFNSCYSRAQAEAVVQHVPAAIGMNTEIGDVAARTFSAAFYSAIGFGHSVNRAFQQAKAALMLEGIPEESVPELFLASGIDGDQLVLVCPPSGASPVPESTRPTHSVNRRIDATMVLVAAGNVLTSRMHFLLNTSKQATKVVAAHGMTPGVRSSLQHAFDELEKALIDFDKNVEATQAAFPDLGEPTLQLMMFRNLAYTLGSEWRWQWKTRFEAVKRVDDPMERENPWNRFDWAKVFDGREPDAGVIDQFALEFSRRVDSWGTHILDGHDPSLWWPARKREERERFRTLLESRSSELTPEKRKDIEATIDRLHLL